MKNCQIWANNCKETPSVFRVDGMYCCPECMLFVLKDHEIHKVEKISMEIASFNQTRSEIDMITEKIHNDLSLISKMLDSNKEKSKIISIIQKK